METTKYVEKLAPHGDVVATFRLGLRHLYNKLKTATTNWRAFQLMMTAAEGGYRRSTRNGNPRAIGILGLSFIMGLMDG